MRLRTAIGVSLLLCGVGLAAALSREGEQGAPPPPPARAEPEAPVRPPPAREAQAQAERPVTTPRRPEAASPRPTPASTAEPFEPGPDEFMSVAPASDPSPAIRENGAVQTDQDSTQWAGQRAEREGAAEQRHRAPPPP